MKIFTFPKRHRFALLDFETHNVMQNFWLEAKIGGNGIDQLGFQVEIICDPYGIEAERLQQKVYSKNNRPFSALTTYIPADPFVNITHSKFFQCTSEEISKFEKEVKATLVPLPEFVNGKNLNNCFIFIFIFLCVRGHFYTLLSWADLALHSMANKMGVVRLMSGADRGPYIVLHSQTSKI